MGFNSVFKGLMSVIFINMLKTSTLIITLLLLLLLLLLQQMFDFVTSKCLFTVSNSPERQESTDMFMNIENCMKYVSFCRV